jgi:hypothetical protein
MDADDSGGSIRVNLRDPRCGDVREVLNTFATAGSGALRRHREGSFFDADFADVRG